MAIYSSNHRELQQLLNEAASSDGASLLIPNLQRPYVWKPDQVILLIDSLLKGWPFGTLLLWDLGNVSEDKTLVPSRRFWTVVDKTNTKKGIEGPAAAQPAHFEMVLDGQQRIQSLVLAFSSEGGGLMLLDRDWREAIDGFSPYRGPNVGKRWTLGQLCLDLDALDRLKYDDGEGFSLRTDVDMRSLLCWVNTGQPGSESNDPPRPEGYKRPLPRASESPGRYLNCARLWSRALNWKGDDESLRESCKELLSEHGAILEEVSQLWRPLRSLVKRLKDAQSQPVEFLQIRVYSAQSFREESEYRDAVVNIFTRLNSGGRLLTREEITYAWIKVEWDALSPVGPSANVSFENLLAALGRFKLTLGLDELVRLLSVVWSGTMNQGKALGNRDLLDGSTLRNVARWLHSNWAGLDHCIQHEVEVLSEVCRLEFGRHYRSVNTIALLTALCYLPVAWVAEGRRSAANDAAVEEWRAQFLKIYAEKWLVISQWSGRWAQRTDEVMAERLSDLATLTHAISKEVELKSVFVHVATQMANWIQGLLTEATQFLQNLEVQDRQAIGQYFLPLWVWHHSSADREFQSSITLKEVGTRATPRLEVDHVVSHYSWDTTLSEAEKSEFFSEINALGNTVLLSKTFNISKSSRSLDTWLAGLDVIPGFDAASWKVALYIDDAMASGISQGNLQEIRAAILARTNRIKEDLVAYIANVP